MYRIKLKIGWSGKQWYIVQRRIMFIFWIGIHDYETKESAEFAMSELNLINNA